MGLRHSNASGGHVVPLPSAFWSQGTPRMANLGASLLLCISAFYTVSELRKACFRQPLEACVAQAVLTPSAVFHPVAFALPPSPPKSHLCPLPLLAVSD